MPVELRVPIRLGPAAPTAGRRAAAVDAPTPGLALAAADGAVELALVRGGAARDAAGPNLAAGARVAGARVGAAGRIAGAARRLPARLLERVSGRVAGGPDTFLAVAAFAGPLRVEGIPLPDTLRLAGGKAGEDGALRFPATVVAADSAGPGALALGRGMPVAFGGVPSRGRRDAGG